MTDFAKLVEATFVARKNRFIAEVILDGETILAHLPNTGRMQELLIPGAQCYLAPADNPNRKTAYTLLLITYNNGLVCLKAGLANDFFGLWLAQQAIAELSDWSVVRREVTCGKSRFDFLLSDGVEEILAEVKSVNLVRDGVALFPDAPTVRGSKHLDELIAIVQAGGRAMVVFVVMGQAATSFVANRDHDPVFAEKLAQAYAAGVMIRIYRSKLTVDGVIYEGQLPYVVD